MTTSDTPIVNVHRSSVSGERACTSSTITTTTIDSSSCDSQIEWVRVPIGSGGGVGMPGHTPCEVIARRAVTRACRAKRRTSAAEVMLSCWISRSGGSVGAEGGSIRS